MKTIIGQWPKEKKPLGENGPRLNTRGKRSLIRDTLLLVYPSSFRYLAFLILCGSIFISKLKYPALFWRRLSPFLFKLLWPLAAFAKVKPDEMLAS